MKFSSRSQVLTCLMMYASCVHAIMVKFGTKGGPIEPPPPEEEFRKPEPYVAPAPVWEERTDDTPDPNAQWRPPLFIPQQRYTQVAFSFPTVPENLSNAQQFVNSYIPKHNPVQVQPIQDYLKPNQILSAGSLPGVGLRYFVPLNVNKLQEKKEKLKQEDVKHNEIETNEINVDADSPSERKWKQEKDLAKRTVRRTEEGTANEYRYQWPIYVPPRH